MKNISKACGLTLTAMLVCLFVYPFIHESGHAIAILVNGGKVFEFSVFPEAYVLCDTSMLSNFQTAFCVLCGIAAPFITAAVFRPKNSFILWFVSLVLRTIVMLSLIISVITLAVSLCGITVRGDDMEIFSGCTPFAAGIVLMIFLISGAAFFAAGIVRERPVHRMCEEFGIA